MLTSAQAADIVATIEESVVDSISADSWLTVGGTGGINTISTGAIDRAHPFAAHELPALTVAVTDVAHTFSNSAPMGAYEVTAQVAIVAVCAGGDCAALHEEIGEIAAHVTAWAADQNHADGNRLDGLLETGDRVDHVKVSRIRLAADRRMWRATARIDLRVTLWAAHESA